MSELGYIGPEDLVISNTKNGIFSGGFSVKSIMMKAGMSPIMTVNKPDGHIGGSSDKVSDLFNDLVVPNWTLSYNNRLTGGKYTEHNHNDSDSEDDVIDDDLHERLLELVKNKNDVSAKGLKKKLTRKVKKNLTKKGTKKRK
jgi:hypothetical protein